MITKTIETMFEPKLNIELGNYPSQPGPIHFYELKYYWLSNFSSFSVEFNGERFPTSEAAYQSAKFLPNTSGMAQKFNIEKDLFREVGFAKSAHESYKLARKYQEYVRPDWDQVKRDIMKEICRAKFLQHEYIQKKLKDTGDRELIEASPIDDFWGFGPSGDGRNELGKIWMELREEYCK